jgi:hypothetical protein
MFTLNVTNNYFQNVNGTFVPPPQSGGPWSHSAHLLT